MPRAAKPIICYVTDRRGLPPSANQQPDRATGSRDEEEVLRFRALGRIILSAISSGVDWIQVREKDAPANLLYTVVSAAAGPLPMVAAPPSATNKPKTKIIVNDRLDVALAARADGVHLGETSIPLADALPLLRKRPGIITAANNFYLGRSCHSIESALAAEHDGAHYIFFGPVFPTPSKAAFGPPQGLETLVKVCRSVRIPVLAVGGITLENARQCVQAGAAGIAAIRLFQEASNLRETIARLRSSFETHTSS